MGVRCRCAKHGIEAVRTYSIFWHSSPLTIWSTPEQLIPHANIVFSNRHYAQIQSLSYAGAPPACLLALTPPYALLVAVLGCRWRRSALRPEMGVLPVQWVVHTAHSPWPMSA